MGQEKYQEAKLRKRVVILQSDSRTSDEGRSSDRRSQAHSPSTSSLFSRQNLTLEEIPTSTPPLTPVSPKMSTSRQMPSSRPAKPTPRPSSQSLVRALAQQAASQQPKVEDDVESFTPIPMLVKTPTEKQVDAFRPNIRLSTLHLLQYHYQPSNKSLTNPS